MTLLTESVTRLVEEFAKLSQVYESKINEAEARAMERKYWVKLLVAWSYLLWLAWFLEN